MWYKFLIVSERRRYSRKKTLNLVFYNDRGIGRTRDLSVKGALIEADKKPPSSSRLELAIGVEKFYPLTARVIWVQKVDINKWHFGIEFDTIQEFPTLNIRQTF